MAIAVPTITTTAWAPASSCAITKPSGLAVGDLMVGIVGYQDGSVTITPPSGWTAIRTTTDGNIGVISAYKIATSSDVSASNFTFTSSTSGQIAGGILRITGHSAGLPIWTSNGDITSNTTTPSLANTITPAIADSLIILSFANKAGTGTISNYAIVTSNPSWTEAFDLTTASQFSIGVAYATRTQTTATGNASASFTGSASSDWAGQQIAVTISKDVSATDGMTMVDSAKEDIDCNVSDTTSITDDPEALLKTIFNQSKSVTTWLNENKS